VGVALLIGGVMVSSSDKTGTVLTTVQSSLAAIQEGQKATREDIGKLSDKLDTTADGLADTKAEVAGIKAAQETQGGELARMRDRMREYEDRRRTTN
jgi:peptidoglycan hydrolase CwlO-like protein